VLALHLELQRVAPTGEQAHAVAAGEQFRRMLDRGIAGQAEVHELPDVVPGPDVERERGDDAEPPQRDDGTLEALVAAAHRHEVAVRGHELHPGDGRGHHLVRHPRAVSARRARPGDADVRQGTEVAQRPAGSVQLRGELAEAQAGRDGDRPRVGVDLDPAREARHAEQVPGRVGDRAERVPRAERAQPGRRRDQPAHLVDRFRLEQPARRVHDVARPVAADVRRHRPGRPGVVHGGPPRPSPA
jgi:hypothetical protein